MRQIVCKETGSLDELELVEVPDPTPGPGRVVVRVESAGVNYVDALFVLGRYQIKPQVPFTPGSELAGVVAAIGDGVEGWAIGDRVVAMAGLGGFADLVELSPMQLTRVPGALDSPTAAAFTQSYCTALFSLTRRTHLAPGEWVVVAGAAGGVGEATTRVAVALGAHVLAIAGTDEKRAAALVAGAAEAIDYGPDLKDRIRAITGGGADVVVDPVGGPHADGLLRSLGNLGRYLVIGFAAGEIPSLPLNQVLLRNRTVVGVDWGAWSMSDADGQRVLLDEALALVADGRIVPSAPGTRPLAECATALADLMERRVTGKLVLVP